MGIEDCSYIKQLDYWNILNQVALFYQYPVLINNSNNNNMAYNNHILKDTNNIFLCLADDGHYFWINQNGNIIYNHQNKSNQILFQKLEFF